MALVSRAENISLEINGDTTVDVASGATKTITSLALADGGSPGAVRKTGSGKLVLSVAAPASVVTGWQIDAGTFDIAADDPFGAFDGTIVPTVSVGANAILSASQPVTLGDLSLAAGSSLAKSGYFSDAMTVGTGTGATVDSARVSVRKPFAFNGTVRATGNATIEGGAVTLANGTGATVFDVASGVTLTVNGVLACGLASDGTTALKSGFSKTGAGTLKLLGACSAAGEISLAAGQLALGPHARLAETARLVESGGTLTLLDGAVLDVGSADSTYALLASANVWVNADRARTNAQGRVTSLVNLGTCGGTFGTFATSKGGNAVAGPKLSASPLNGHQLLDFDGNSSLYTDAYTNTTRGLTIFTVARGTGGSYGTTFSMMTPESTATDLTTGGATHLEFLSATDTSVYFSAAWGTGKITNPNRTSATPFLHRLVATGGTNYVFTEYINASKTALTSTCTRTSTGSYNIRRVALGARLDAGAVPTWYASGNSNNRMYKGAVGEFIVFTRTLSNAESEQVERYLKEKWFADAAPAGETHVTVPLTADVGAGATALAAGQLLPCAGGTDAALRKTGAGALKLALQAYDGAKAAVDEGSVSFGETIASRAEVWADAADTSTVTLGDDGRVAKLHNKGRAGGDFVRVYTWSNYFDKTNTDYTPGPRYTSQSGVLNGLPALDFRADAALGLHSYTNMSSPRSAHVYLVYRRSKSATTYSCPFSMGRSDSSVRDDYQQDGMIGWQWYASGDRNYYRVGSAKSCSVTNALLFTSSQNVQLLHVAHHDSIGCTISWERPDTDPIGWKFNWTDVNGAAYLKVNLVMLGSRIGTYGCATWPQTKTSNYDNRTWYGLVGEMIVFDKPLSEAEDAALLAYLRKKWFAKGDATVSAAAPKFLSGDYDANDLTEGALQFASGTSVTSAAPTMAIRSLAAEAGVTWARQAPSDWSTPFFDSASSLVFTGNQNLVLDADLTERRLLFGGANATADPTWTARVDGKEGTTPVRIVRRNEGIYARPRGGLMIYLR